MKKKLIGLFSLVTVVLTAGTLQEKFEVMPSAEQWQLAVASENSAKWEIRDGVLFAVAQPGKSGMILLKNAPSDNYGVEVDFKFNSLQNKHAGLVFRAMPPGSRQSNYFTGFIFNVYDNKVVLQMVDPVWRKLREVALLQPLGDSWHHIKVEVADESIKCFLDGNLLIEEASGKFEQGVPGLRVASGSEVSFRNFKVDFKE